MSKMISKGNTISNSDDWPNITVQTEPVTWAFQFRSGQEFAADMAKDRDSGFLPPLSS